MTVSRTIRRICVLPAVFLLFTFIPEPGSAEEVPSSLIYTATLEVYLGDFEISEPSTDSGRDLQAFSISRALSSDIRYDRAQLLAGSRIAAQSAGLEFSLDNEYAMMEMIEPRNVSLRPYFPENAFHIGEDRTVVIVSSPALNKAVQAEAMYTVTVTNTVDIGDLSETGLRKLEYAFDDLMHQAVMQAVEQDRSGRWTSTNARGFILPQSSEITMNF